MRAGQFVGRVGGLAVALGIGVAIAHGSPAAWAEETGADGPSDSGGETKTAGPGDSATGADQKAADPATPSARRTAPRVTVTTASGGSRKQRSSVVRKGAVSTVSVAAPSKPEPPAPDDSPSTPADSPLQSALEAVGSRSRSFGALAAPQTASLVDAPPTVVEQPVGTPDPLTGVVNGTVLATTPGPNSLSYAVTTTPKKGTVELNAQSGAYTYTPTPAARIIAGTTPTADTDSFAVGVSDGQQTTSAAVSVYISPIKLENQTPIAVGTNPTGMALAPDGRMFVLNTGGKSVSVIDTVTGKRIDANPSWFSKDIGVGAAPGALALSTDGKRLYVANTGGNSVSVIDTVTYKTIDANPSRSSKVIAVGKAPGALALGSDGRLYVANAGSNTVSVIDTSTHTPIDVDPNMMGIQGIPVGMAPSSLAFGSDGRLYVANRGSNSLSVIDGLSVTGTVALGGQPSSVAAGPGGRLYVTNAGSATVSVVDPATAAVQQISVGPAPSSIAFSPNGTLAYVANANDTISVIDVATAIVVHTVAIDTDLTGGHVIAVGPNGTIYVTDAADKTVRVVTARFGNAAPVSGVPTVGKPNSGSGAVSGALNVTDRDGDNLSYNVTQPVTGTVDITSAGLYTFTPTFAARLAAAGGGPKSTSFTVTAGDGQSSTVVSVTVPITPPVAATRISSLGTVSVTGWQVGSAPLSTPDGTRAVITTVSYGSSTTTRVAVVNVSTGRQVGSTLTLTGTPDSPVLSADGTRALITTSVPNTTTGISTTRATVLDVATGKQVGTTVSVAGSPAGTQFLGTDGKRALIVTDAYDVYDWDGSVAHTTGVAVLDTGRGVQIGAATVSGAPADTTISDDHLHAVVSTADGSVAVFDIADGSHTVSTDPPPAGGSPQPVPLDSAGNRAVVTTRLQDPVTGAESTRVAVIDTITGGEIGRPITLAGAGYAQVTGHGARVLLSTTEGSWDTGFTNHVAVLDAQTGIQVGSTLTLKGSSSLELSADGMRALITMSDRDAGNNDIARIAVLDISTGTTTFTPQTLLKQSTFGSRFVTADGSRALIITNVYDSGISVNTTRLTLIDTATGNQIGTPTSLTGFLNGPAYSMNTDRAVITTISSNFKTTGKATTEIAVINTVTGTQVGRTLTLNDDTGYAVLSADGTRAVVTTGPQLALINTVTGTLAGTIIKGGSSPQFSPDGTRVLIWTGNYPTRLTVLQIT